MKFNSFKIVKISSISMQCLPTSLNQYVQTSVPDPWHFGADAKRCICIFD